MAGSGNDRLIDPAELEEIEMLGALMIAANESGEPLPQDQIDTILGIDRPS